MSVIIRLQNLPLAANASDVRSFFKGLSIPDGGVHIVGGALGDAFIAFSTDEDARQAMALNGGCIKNEPISLLLSSRAEMQKVIEQARKAALSYMQLKQAATVAAVLPKAAVPVQRPTVPATTTVSPLSVAGSKAAPTASSLAQFHIPPPAKIAAGGTTTPASIATQQQPQPPVISLAGFLAKAAASATVAPAAPAATTVATLSPLLAQGSSYNEIPGLSFLSSDAAADEAGPVMAPLARAAGPTLPSNGGNLSDWLSALNSQAAKAVVPPVAAEMPRPIIVNDQSPWKFLKKDRRSRSRSRSRERSYRRGSRSSSRERDNRRRSRSSSRGRTYNRDADSHSRSSSRERNTRWSRSSSRERRSGRGRRRNSRSRSPSRDRFGRTRQRSRSRSRDRRSHDSNSRDRYDASNGGRSRFSDKNDLEFVALQQQQQQQHSINGGAFAGLNQTMEPIFGLHTGPGGMADSRARFGNNNQQQPNHFSTRSGKISPLPSGNGLNGGFGGMFRNTSPLPESVYSSAKSGAITSDYAVKISNLESVTGYGEIRRFFKSHLITTQGIKMINDQNGRRTGTAYIQFLRKEGKKFALSRDGSAVRRMRVRIESITDQEFDSAVDSYRPGMSHNGKAWDDQNPRNVNPWSTNDYLNEGRNGGGGGRAGSSDVIEIADDRDEPRHDSGRRPPPVAASSALVVWNLPTFTTEQDIMKMFSDFTVVEVLIVKNHHAPKQLDGYVKFHRQEDAQEAWKQVHRHFIGNKKVTVLVCQEIDYEVAKNEHENPRDVEESSSSEQQQQQNADGQMERERTGSENGQSEEQESVNGSSSGNGGNNGRQGRSSKHGSRWGSVERPWDDDTSENIALKNMMLEAQRRMNAEAAGAANSESNGPWNVRDDRMSRGNSLGNDSDNNGNSNGGNQSNEAINNMQIMNFINNMNQMNNNGNGNQQQQQQQQQQQGGGNSRDPRRANSRFAPSNDSSEMFQRTNWLLLRNVDFHVYEEDVFAFFGHDGFQAKNVLLVHNERGGRTGECLVEFGSASEAAHAESKSSQNLGRRKVFASHLDRGQVADLMARFHAIAQGLQPSHWLPDHLRNENSNGGGGSGGGGGGGGSGGGSGGSQNDDPEKNQGVGCGPYRTSTVGLLNLAYKTTVEDVQKFFQEFNLPLENIRRRFLDNGNATGEAMVRFRNHQDAEKALNEYQNRKLFGRNVRLRLINDD